MGLSAELQGYAENIWRRFPEVFISLGSPDVEDFFELKESGSWSHSIVDTLSEKVIEIVLPRRGRSALYSATSEDISNEYLEDGEPEDTEEDEEEGEGHEEEEDDDEEEEEDDEEEEANTIDASLLLSPSSSAASPLVPVHCGGLLFDIDLQVDRLSRAISHLESTLEECVSREVCAQLAAGFSSLFGRTEEACSLPPVREVAGRYASAPAAAAAMAAGCRGHCLPGTSRRRPRRK